MTEDAAGMHLQAHAHGVQELSAVLQAKDEAACVAIERNTIRTHALKTVDCLLQLLQVSCPFSSGRPLHLWLYSWVL